MGRKNTPESRLGSRTWRLWHSKWMVPVVFGWGLFSFVGFLYTGIRVRNLKFWTAAAVGCAGSAAAWIAPFQLGLMSVPVIFGLWAGLVTYSGFLNRDYLRWRAGQTQETIWYNQPVEQVTAAPSESLSPGAQALHAVAKVEQRIAGQVPPAVAVQVRRVTVAINQMVPRLDSLGSQDSWTVVSTATRYLPEAVDTYLELPRGFAETHHVLPGKTSTTILVEQLDLLGTTLEEMLHALSERDAIALAAHGAFLAEKFGDAGDLDLSTSSPQPATQATARPAAQATAQPAPQATAQPAAKPTTQPAAQPVAKPATRPASTPQPAAKPKPTTLPASSTEQPGTPLAQP